MALVRCKVCDCKCVVGFMPTASCGLLLVPAMGAGAWAGILVFEVLRPYSPWLAWPGAVLAGFLALLLSVLAIHHIPWTLEWALAMRHRCPDCGARKWSYPFTEGFGL